jgi:3-isopropylmalate/(R)-2-methylmalate dehydratase small subunit
MQSFTTFTSVAAPLPITNIDTDMIIPKQFLKTIKRTGLGVNLFDEMRYTIDGKEIPEFILNQPAYRKSGILIAGENFGCGSSREHAPWSLLDFGVRSIIAPSFADIFYNNCFKNGILPIVLPKEQVDELMQHAAGTQVPVTIDLPAQKITAGNKIFSFDVEPFRKKCLLEGLDDIGLTLQKVDKIGFFESKNKLNQRWLYKEA